MSSVPDVYESAVDPSGRRGAVFERDDDTAFFYLFDLSREDGDQIVEAFNAHSLTSAPAGAHVSIRWSPAGEAVGLFVDDDLVALFDLRNERQEPRWATDVDNSLFAIH